MASNFAHNCLRRNVLVARVVSRSTFCPHPHLPEPRRDIFCPHHPHSSLSTLPSRFIPQNSPFSTQTRTPKQQVSTNSQHDAALHSQKTASKRESALCKKPNSLRRVAVEAQYTRDRFIKRSGKRRFVDPEAETSQVTAYCAAEQYNIPIARHLLGQEGYIIDPLNTGFSPQVIHVQTPIKNPEKVTERTRGPGDVFIFPSGCIVTWNLPESQELHLVNHVLLPAAENPHLDTVEVEDLRYLEDSSNDTSRIIGDTIVLGTKPNIKVFEDNTRSELLSPASSEHVLPSVEIDTILAKIAFSSGLARSTKLAVLENLLATYFSSTRSISTILSTGSKLRFTRPFILRKTGELLSIRAQLNLYSELTDSLPDLFWDSPSSLGLSDYYDEVGRALDVNARIRVLNEKIDYASEIATVLRERLSEKHSTDLEWLIIFLISVEVVFELSRIWRERHEMNDPDSTDALLKDYLLRERLRNHAGL